MIRRTMMGAGALAVSLALVPAALAGGKADVKLKVTLNPSVGQPAPHFLHGKIKSKKNACKKQREVKVFFKPTHTLETITFSDSQGEWTAQIDTPNPAGIYIAKVASNAKCKGAKVEAFVPAA
jgi:hypothetical protein